MVKRALFHIAIACAVIGAVVVALVGAGVWSPGEKPHDSAALLVEDNGRLRHPALGFSVASPGPTFHPAPGMAAVMRQSYAGQDAEFYAYADAGPSAILLITAIHGHLDLAKELDTLAHGMERGAAQQHAPFSIVERHVEGNEAALHIVMGEMHARLHAYARDTFAVTVMVMSRDEHALESVLTSLR